MTPVRVGLIGARRARQGLGPFLARDLRAAGAAVPCFLVKSEASLVEADRQLRETAGIAARGYTDLPTLLASETLDALVVSSPHESHRGVLEAAAHAGLHVLCEKPLIWGKNDLAAGATACIAAFEEAGRELWENCQWPYTLPAFDRLHPGTTSAPPRHFFMLLQPSGSGARMLADSLPHPLSLLQHLAPGPDPKLEGVRFSSTDPAASRVFVRFRYRAGAAETACEVELRPTRKHPREVALAVDGRRARRKVSAPDYRLGFEDGARTVAFDDPLRLLVADFVAAMERGGSRQAGARHRRIVERMALLDELRAAWEQAQA